ncbi:hypothetical protein PMAYCL1PPCAC_10645, partial [Pristionchus mayeri]
RHSLPMVVNAVEGRASPGSSLGAVCVAQSACHSAVQLSLLQRRRSVRTVSFADPTSARSVIGTGALSSNRGGQG